MSSQQPTPPREGSLFADRHTVETPEQIQLQFALAGVGSRFLAIALDTLMQAAFAAFIGLSLFFLSWTGLLKEWHLTSLWLTAALIAFLFILQFGYFAVFEIFWNGQTPGKRAIGIRVIKDTGRPLSPAETIGRNLLRIIDQLPGFYAVAVLTAMFNAQGKRLGDFVAGALVVREKSLDEIQHSWATSPASTSSLLGANRLTPDEVALIDAFLTRRGDLDPGVRHRMALEILRRLESKLTLTADNRTRVETTLEWLAHENRSHARY